MSSALAYAGAELHNIYYFSSSIEIVHLYFCFKTLHILIFQFKFNIKIFYYRSFVSYISSIVVLLNTTYSVVVLVFAFMNLYRVPQCPNKVKLILLPQKMTQKQKKKRNEKKTQLNKRCQADI